MVSLYSSSELSSSESMSGGSGSSKNDGRLIGMYFSPVKVNAPESLMNLVSAAMPLGVPRSSGRASSRFSSRSLALWVSYHAQEVMMCSQVCKVSPHSQLTLFSGKNCFLNSPVYAWPVRHWIRRPNTSRWFCSSVK